MWRRRLLQSAGPDPAHTAAAACMLGWAYALLSMEGSFAKQVSGEGKWTDSLQLLRLIAAPGMGKVCRNTWQQ